ncbi:MAG TPA: hypothetical protein VEJ20_08995 [Candidatus Eremiobacteraceae bacterium]|nr:hypothetical protein [Candidatus Eremiobacteraceae bacterium]
MRLILTGFIATAFLLAIIPAMVYTAPQRPPHYTHPPAPNHVPVTHNPVPHLAPDQFHPASKPIVEYHPKVNRDVVIHDTTVYQDITNYHINEYHTTVNVYYAGHPGIDHGYWTNGWYHGYWHDYWQNQQWMWWSNHYGFWLDLDGMNVFVYEYSPGVCWYWNGYEWLPWYNPPYTPYQCPY